MNDRGREKGDDVQGKGHSASRQSDRYERRILVDVEPVSIRLDFHFHFHEPLVIKIESSGGQEQIAALTAQLKEQNDALAATVAAHTNDT